MSATCASCGVASAPRDAFCGQCGTPLRVTSVHRGDRRRRWFQRPLVVLPLVVLLLIGGVGAYLLLQAGTTVATIHRLSTPAASVSIDAFGDDVASGKGGGAPRVGGGRTDTGPSTTQIDTAPAVRSLEADARYAEFAETAAGRFGGVQEVAGGVAAAASGQEAGEEPLNILLMGVDARPGESIDIAVRPDALAVLHLDPANESCRLLAIPRDTRVELPGYGPSKVNHALAVGGIPYQMQVVEGFLGIELDHYGLIDFGGIVRLVDAVDGVTVDVPEAFTTNDITFEAGPQTLDGEEALVYARYRGGADGDFGRIRRQQQVLRGIIAGLSGRDVPRVAVELLLAMRDHTRTDLNPAELVDLATRYQGSCTEDAAGMDTLDGTTGTYPDPLLDLDLSYVIVDEAEVRAKVEWLLGQD